MNSTGVSLVDWREDTGETPVLQRGCMFEVSFGAYRAWVAGEMPVLADEYRKRAALLEEFDLEREDEAGIGLQDEWPRIVVAQRCVPGMKLGFHPGLLIVPETGVAFLGAGERLLAY